MNNYNLEETNVVFGYWKVLRKEKKILKLMLVDTKFEGKYKGKKIKRKSIGKGNGEKVAPPFILFFVSLFIRDNL